MNYEALSIPELVRLNDTDVSPAYAEKFTDSYGTDRWTARGLINGDSFGLAVPIPHISANRRLFCQVSVHPASCLFKSDDVECVRLPTQLLSNAFGTLTVGVSALGKNNGTDELGALRKLDLGMRTVLTSHRDRYYDMALIKPGNNLQLCGLMLESAGFTLGGIIIGREVLSHTELARVLVRVFFCGCMPAFNISWYASLPTDQSQVVYDQVDRPVHFTKPKPQMKANPMDGWKIGMRRPEGAYN